MTKENTASPVAKTSSENKKMNLYRSNGVPPAYSDMAEEVQRGREAKIAHLLKQVGNNRNDLLTLLPMHVGWWGDPFSCCILALFQH